MTRIRLRRGVLRKHRAALANARGIQFQDFNRGRQRGAALFLNEAAPTLLRGILKCLREKPVNEGAGEGRR